MMKCHKEKLGVYFNCFLCLKSWRQKKSPDPRTGYMKGTSTNFISLPKVSIHNWLWSTLIIEVWPLERPADPMANIFLLDFEMFLVLTETLDKIMLLSCKSGNVTRHPFPVHLSKCFCSHFGASFKQYSVLWIWVILKGRKSLHEQSCVFLFFEFWYMVFRMMNLFFQRTPRWRKLK